MIEPNKETTTVGPDDVTTRDAIASDLPQIVRIYNSTISSRMVTADTEPVSIESKKQWFAEHSMEFRPLWVMEYAGEMCGWLSFQSFYGRPAYNATAEVSIYLEENYRGKGLGRYFLQKAMDDAPNLGIRTLLGFIFAHNEPSLKLFAELEFEQWAHLPKIAQIDDTEMDLIIVGKSLVDRAL